MPLTSAPLDVREPAPVDLVMGAHRLDGQASAEALSAPEGMVPPVTAPLLHAASGHPPLTRRVDAVERRFGARSRVEPSTARRAASWRTRAAAGGGPRPP